MSCDRCVILEAQLKECLEVLSGMEEYGGSIDSETAHEFRQQACSALTIIRELDKGKNISPSPSHYNLESHAPGINRELDIQSALRHPISGHPLK